MLNSKRTVVHGAAGMLTVTTSRANTIANIDQYFNTDHAVELIKLHLNRHSVPNRGVVVSHASDQLSEMVAVEVAEGSAKPDTSVIRGEGYKIAFSE